MYMTPESTLFGLQLEIGKITPILESAGVEGESVLNVLNNPTLSYFTSTATLTLRYSGMAELEETLSGQDLRDILGVEGDSISTLSWTQVQPRVIRLIATMRERPIMRQLRANRWPSLMITSRTAVRGGPSQIPVSTLTAGGATQITLDEDRLSTKHAGPSKLLAGLMARSNSTIGLTLHT